MLSKIGFSYIEVTPQTHLHFGKADKSLLSSLKERLYRVLKSRYDLGNIFNAQKQMQLMRSPLTSRIAGVTFIRIVAFVLLLLYRLSAVSLKFLVWYTLILYN